MPFLFNIFIRYLISGGLFAFILACSANSTFAQDPVFQQNSQEMIQELTKEPVKYRSFAPAGKKRSIVVMEKKHNQAVSVVGSTQAPSTGFQEYGTKTIQVVDNQATPSLKLKVEFDTNSAGIRPCAYPLLKELGVALTSKQLWRANILVGGHTDADGGDDYNLRLSLERADAVRQFLVSVCDVPNERLRVRGYGEAMPLKPNSTPYYKQMNRRVEVRIDN